MVFNATFNNFSAISWRSVLLVEETGVPWKNHWPVASHWQTWSWDSCFILYVFFAYDRTKFMSECYQTRVQVLVTAVGVKSRRLVCEITLLRFTFLWKCLYQVRVITVFTVFRLLTDFVCLYNYEFWLSLCKIVRSSVILLLPLFTASTTCVLAEPMGKESSEGYGDWYSDII